VATQVTWLALLVEGYGTETIIIIIEKTTSMDKQKAKKRYFKLCEQKSVGILKILVNWYRWT